MATVDPRFYELASALQKGGAFAHYWIPSRDDGQKYSLWYPVNGHVPEPPANWAKQDLYFSVNPAGAAVDRSVHTKTHKSDVAAVNCLYAEFDLKDWPDEPALVGHIATLQPVPSAIVASGGGYHCYWLLADTYQINTPAARLHIDQVETAWVAFVRGDQTVHDLARVLRVPGTQNFKYNPPREVSFIRFTPGCVYDLADLVHMLEAAGQWPPKQSASTAAARGGATLDDHELLDLARKSENGARFERLWAGNIDDYRNDQSAADLALCTMLAFWTQKDEARIDHLFRQSGLMRQKWERDEYRERTIRRACDSVYSVYEPGEEIDQDAVKAAQAAVGVKLGTQGTPAQTLLNTAPASTTTANDIEADLAAFPPNDEGNAQAVLLLYGDVFLYCDAYGWLYWTGTHWRMEGAEDQVRAAVTETMKLRQIAAVKLGKDQVIRAAKPNWSTVKNCIEMFRPKVVTDVSVFDADPDSFNCANGVVDLRTGVLVPHDARPRFTYCSTVTYDPNADYVEWVEFLASVVDPSVVPYLQMAAGYSITGHTREEILFYVHGPTRSGKGTFTESLLKILPYPLGIEADFATFTAERKGDTQNFDLAPLKPARMIVASESSRYETLNEAKVKSVTGGNWIRCAYKHRDHFEYRPQFKIWLTSNHPVKGDVDDDAFWGRVRVIEFPNSHLGREDKGLKERMKSPAVQRGILRWLVEGAMAWYAAPAGLEAPAAVVNTTAARRADLDYVAQWIDDCCKTDLQNLTAYWTANTALYSSYTDWCRANGVMPKMQEQWGRSLSQKGYKTRDRRRMNGKIVFGTGGILII